MDWTGIDIYTVAAGRIAELVREADTLALLQQLGVAPPPAGAPPGGGPSDT